MESCNREQNDLDHIQSIFLTWALACIDVELDIGLDVELVVVLLLSSLGWP